MPETKRGKKISQWKLENKLKQSVEAMKWSSLKGKGAEMEEGMKKKKRKRRKKAMLIGGCLGG